MVHRAADVCLKEKRPLIIVARETPLNRIHLENMLKLSDAGAVIMPASPSFYSSPASIEDLVDTIIARILNHLNIDHQIIPQWGD
jgi:4-hydroxy-3-polyprenylbenzoate decarboxylase